MKKFFTLLLALMLFSAIPAVVRAQELWGGGTLELELSKKLDFEVEEQLRLKEDFIWYKQLFTEMGLQYKLSKRFEVKGQYRFTLKPDHNENRFSGDISYETKKNDWDLQYRFRTRYQLERETDNDPWSHTLRGRAGIRYDIAKEANPFFEIETFYRLDDKNEFRKWRFTAGVGLPITKHLDGDFFYRIEKNINQEFPTTDHVIGISFKYEIELHKE